MRSFVAGRAEARPNHSASNVYRRHAGRLGSSTVSRARKVTCPSITRKPRRRSELRWLEQYESEAEELKKGIETLYMQLDPHRTLERIPGIGTLIASGIEAIVGNVLRFPNGGKFVSYCGLRPRKKQTGHSDPSMPITKCGNRILKKHLYLAADVARHHDAWARAFAQMSDYFEKS